jgi:hypothetical protein
MMMKRITALLSLGLLLLACDPPEVEVAVSSVSVSPSSVELTVGESTRLSATVSPSDAKDKTVTWSTSSASVATVSPSGEVTAVAVGSANITASAGGKSAVCKVTVVNPTVSVSSVTLDKDRLDLTVGGTAKLTATVSPADASDKNVTWESSDATVATVDKDGNVKALKGGTSTVTAKAGGKSASALVDVMEVTPSSIEVESAGGDIKVTVVTTRKYHLDSKPDWITEVSVDKQVHTFKVAANTDTSERSGVIVICDEVGTCLSCQVKQAGLVPVFSISPEKVEMAAEGGTFDVTVTANVPYHVSSTPDWVTQKSQKDNVYTFEVAANTDTSERSGVVVICDETGTCLPCSVKQAGFVPVFSISPEKVEMAAEGGTFDITVTANTPYHISSTPDWVTQKSQKDNVYTFEVGFNEGSSERSGVIVICDEVGTCLSCTVRQEGVKPFDVSPKQVNVRYDGGTFDITVTSSYGYHINSKPDWVTEKSVNGKVHIFEVGPSSLSEARSGAITFCDDVGTCLSVSVRQEGDPESIDWSKDFFHSSLLMVFTSTEMSRYPSFRTQVADILSQSALSAEIINLHTSGKLGSIDISSLLQSYNLNNFPAIVVDGRRVLMFYNGGQANLKAYLNETQVNNQVSSAIGMESSFTGQDLGLDVRIYLKDAGRYKVTVFITESGIIPPQRDISGTDEHYRHDDVARAVLTDVQGDPFTASANSVKKLHYRFNVPSGYEKDNLKILVVVQKAFGSGSRIVDDGADYGDYYVDNCVSGKAGTLVQPSLVSGTGGGIEDVTNGEPVNW